MASLLTIKLSVRQIFLLVPNNFGCRPESSTFFNSWGCFGRPWPLYLLQLQPQVLPQARCLPLNGKPCKTSDDSSVHVALCEILWANTHNQTSATRTKQIALHRFASLCISCLQKEFAVQKAGSSQRTSQSGDQVLRIQRSGFGKKTCPDESRVQAAVQTPMLSDSAKSLWSLLFHLSQKGIKRLHQKTMNLQTCG